MLQVNELNQYYGGSHILRGVSFEAITGEVTCLLGRNGVGKTTLLKCLMGLIPAKTGGGYLAGEKDHPQQAAPAGAVWRGVCAAGT
ncbi:branched-chain amino acid transport system ATP-binding protein [Enterobacter cloacae]|uniref:Branched-chain amino acid transport system ATP-binding protein n=1 Tax=Enterobacter cloacae TaxID=550 RepID=A0A377LZJ7_ENTCL|nr:branched-chain amino acid transport system ATP-binding protein [Enterobacter cloacae]